MYFDFKTINELINSSYNDNREEKEFTMEELGQYSGENGMPAYVAIEGMVYDVSKIPAWQTGKHFGLTAGQDLSEQFASCHGIIDILANAPKVGILADNEYMNNGINMPMNRLIRQQDTSKFTPDDWIRYTVPLVVYALREPTQGMNLQRIYQKVILMGVLVGLGKTPQQAINQVQEWQSSGTAKLLQGGTTTVGGNEGTIGGTTGTGGGFGTGGTTSGTAGTGVGLGTGGTTSGTTGTSGGFGTGGTTGGTAGTGVGLGTGGTTSGTTGTSGGFGTGGTTGGTAGTSGGFGTGGTTGGTTGTGGGFGTGGTTSGTAGTGAGLGTGGTTGGTAGTGGGFGTGGTTSGTTGTGGGMGTRGTTENGIGSDRLYID